MLNGGQSAAGLLNVLFDDAPLATLLGIDGVSVVMKLPQICIAALTKSGL